MKFSLGTDIMKQVSSTLTRVTSKEILGSSSGGIGIAVTSDMVLFRLRQFDFSVEYTVPVTDAKEGKVSVPIQALDGVVSSLIDMMVTVELVGKKLVISTNTSTSEVYILEDAEDDPLSHPSGEPSFLINREVLTRGLRSVQHAAAESVIKPEIASVHVYTKNNSIYFVSTDTFRLAEMRFLSEEVQNDVSILIPIKSVMKLLRVFEGVSDSSVRFYVQDDGIYLSNEQVLVRTNSVRGSFPDYKSIILDSFDVEVTILKSDVTNFLKKARLFANKLNKLSIAFEGDKMVVFEFSNETVGSTRNTVPAVIKGSVNSLPSFNYKFISDALSVLSDDRVVFSAVNNTAKPLMIRGADDSALTAIVSPLLDK